MLHCLMVMLASHHMMLTGALAIFVSCHWSQLSCELCCSLLEVTDTPATFCKAPFTAHVWADHQLTPLMMLSSTWLPSSLSWNCFKESSAKVIICMQNTSLLSSKD